MLALLMLFYATLSECRYMKSRYFIAGVLFINLSSCGLVQSNHYEGLSESGRQSALASMTTARLCNGYTSPILQVKTEATIRDILLSRGVTSCKGTTVAIPSKNKNPDNRQTPPSPERGAAANTKVVAKASASRSSSSNRYYTGRYGGCYYLTSNANRVYVDRSNCR